MLLSETVVAVEVQVAEHLARADVVNPQAGGADAMSPARLHNALRAEDVGAEEGRRVEHAAAVVTLGSEVHHRVNRKLPEQVLQEVDVTDVAADEVIAP